MGRDAAGRFLGAVVPCSDPPHRALLQPTAHVGASEAAGTDAQWRFNRSGLRPGQLVTWPLLGWTDTDTVRSLNAVAQIATEKTSLYVQRDPQNGASGIDFTMAQLERLNNNEFLYRGRDDRLKVGTETDVLAAAAC